MGLTPPVTSSRHLNPLPETPDQRSVRLWPVHRERKQKRKRNFYLMFVTCSFIFFASSLICFAFAQCERAFNIDVRSVYCVKVLYLMLNVIVPHATFVVFRIP